jgi:hypothetical protein
MSVDKTFHMSIEDVFFFRDRRTVFAGRIAEGEVAIIEPGPATILIDGGKFATVQIEREVIASRALTWPRLEVRALSTREPTGLSKEMVATKKCTLEGAMRYAGHRHLLGLDSPPADYLADDMTLGPRLPEGWDGDAWVKPGGGAYFLRAWNKKEARYAVAQGGNFDEARTELLGQIAHGGKIVEIRVADKATSSR